MAVRPRSWLMLTLAKDKLALSKLAVMLQNGQHSVQVCQNECLADVWQLTSCLLHPINVLPLLYLHQICT